MKQKSIFSFKHLRGESFMFHIRFIKTTMFIDDHFITCVCLRGIFSRFFEYFTNLKKDINEILKQWIVLFLQDEVAELRRCMRFGEFPKGSSNLSKCIFIPKSIYRFIKD